MIAGLSVPTDFPNAQFVSPAEFNYFCARFHGEKSLLFENANKSKIVWPVHQPQVIDDGRTAKTMLGMSGEELTHQFYAVYFKNIRQIFDNINNKLDLAKNVNKFINWIRQKLPLENACHIIFGTVEGYKEFAWMWPHVRCALLDFIKPYKTKMVNVMREGIDVTSNLHPSKLFKKFEIKEIDIKFLMTCSMIFTMPVSIDDKPSGNLPKQ